MVTAHSADLLFCISLSITLWSRISFTPAICTVVYFMPSATSCIEEVTSNLHLPIILNQDSSTLSSSLLTLIKLDLCNQHFKPDVTKHDTAIVDDGFLADNTLYLYIILQLFLKHHGNACPHALVDACVFILSTK